VAGLTFEVLDLMIEVRHLRSSGLGWI